MAVFAAVGCLSCLIIGICWWTLPSSLGSAETFVAYAKLTHHLLGLSPPQRVVHIGTGSGQRKSNASVKEVQGFVEPDVFHSEYLGKEPVVFRKGATHKFGFDLECLTESGKPIQDTLSEQFGDFKLSVFADQYDDASNQKMTLDQYMELAEAAKRNISLPTPYARGFPQSAMRDCRPVDTEKLMNYRSWAGQAGRRIVPEVDNTRMFVSYTAGTLSRMHFDAGDSIFTQVYGRKKWHFIEPKYVPVMQVSAAKLNLFYYGGFDVHHEPVPAEVNIKEVVLEPGDILYFPPMTLHSVYNLDPITIGMDDAIVDFVASLRRHWLLTLSTALNPWIPVQAAKIYFQQRSFSASDLFFSTAFTKNSGTTGAVKQPSTEARQICKAPSTCTL